MPRISKNAATLRDQLTQAVSGITGVSATWPGPPAPTLAQVTAARDNLATSITDTDAKKDAWQIAGQLKATRVDAGYDIMKKVDETTTMLYGPSGAEKLNFGLQPEGAPIEPLHKLIEIVLRDGPVPGSLFFDFENIEGCSYEVVWSTVSNFATIVGSATSSSASDYIIGGLTPGTQYWVRVRPHRGSQTAEWSDPATRVAPV